jgi:hypothetical protein
VGATTALMTKSSTTATVTVTMPRETVTRGPGLTVGLAGASRVIPAPPLARGSARKV